MIEKRVRDGVSVDVSFLCGKTRTPEMLVCTYEFFLI